MGSRQRQDLLSKLGAWGPWGKVEGRREKAERGAEKNVELNKNQKKNKNKNPKGDNTAQ